MEHKEAKAWLCDFIMFCRGAFHSQEEKDRFNKMSEWILSALTDGKANWNGPLPAERIKSLEFELDLLTKERDSALDKVGKYAEENCRLRAEVAELKKRLKFKINYAVPSIFWKDGVNAYANNVYVGRIQLCPPGNTWAITCPPTEEKRWLGEHSTRELAQDAFISAWTTYWKAVHNGSGK